jgi:hypothetical protein
MHAGACTNCSGSAAGVQCDVCASGYFGDPRNGGCKRVSPSHVQGPCACLCHRLLLQGWIGPFRIYRYTVAMYPVTSTKCTEVPQVEIREMLWVAFSVQNVPNKTIRSHSLIPNGCFVATVRPRPPAASRMNDSRALFTLRMLIYINPCRMRMQQPDGTVRNRHGPVPQLPHRGVRSTLRPVPGRLRRRSDQHWWPLLLYVRSCFW